MSRETGLLSEWNRYLHKYGETTWTEDDLAYMVGSASMGVEPDEYDMQWLESKTTLLPPNLLPQVDEEWLIANAPDVENPVLRDVTVSPKLTSGRFTDKEFLEVFPARSPNDLSIRRSRARTVFLLYKHSKRQTDWEYWLPRLVNFDYITTINLLLFNWFHECTWLKFWDRMNCLHSLDDLQKTTKWVSDILKKQPTSMAMRLRYCEAGGVSGYRNPPFGKFDYFEESKSLADGGEPHGMAHWYKEFEICADEVQGNSTPKAVEYMTLTQFIASDLANTHGASTWGKIEWSYGEEKGKFKARKNFLLDIASPEYLAEQTMLNLGKQTNKSFIKPELGKMRIAVTGDIWTYFSQAYLNYLCGGVYLRWPGNTLDESVLEQAERMWEMFKAAELCYGLPFDFAGFDHQPEKDEVKILVGKYLGRGKVNVPMDRVKDWETIFKGTIEGFDNSVMVAQDKGQIMKFGIKGGVQSGIRLTSLLGNYWNSTVTQSCKRFIKGLGLQYDYPSWLRGDDSAIFGKTYWHALIFRLAYAGINAVGNDSKYGIHFQQSEFLRVWYADRAYGYPNRALPSITQRKPWSSDPWDPEGVIKAQLVTVDTLERRMQSTYPVLRKSVAQDWSRIRKQSVRWLELPSTLGGLNILPFTGFIPNKTWPRVEHPQVKMQTGAGSEMRYEERFKEWNPTQGELTQIQQGRMNTKAVADDIRGLGHIFREKYSEELETIKEVEWTKIDLKTFKIDGLDETTRLLNTLENPADLRYMWTMPIDAYGSFRNEENWWKDVCEMARIRKGIRPIEELKNRNIACYTLIRTLERKGLHRAQALDFAFGKVSGILIGSLHPLLAHVVERQVAKTIMTASHKWDRVTLGWFTSTVAGVFGNSLKMSPLSQKMFLW